MSGVDVMAVLRRHAVAERDRLGTTDNDTQAALAAVAELIEADEEFDRALAEYKAKAPAGIGEIDSRNEDDFYPLRHATARRAAALARCRGGAA